jgi:hypothetical protein
MKPSHAASRPALRTAAVAIVLAAVSVLIFGTTKDAGAATTPISPDVTALFGQAVKKVRGTNPPTYSKAIVLEVDGTTSGGKVVTSAAEVSAWRFVFDNQGSRSAYASATVTYKAGSGFGKVVGNRSPFLEDIQIRQAPKMTLTQAVARLGRAGHTEGFSAVTLRNPLGPTPNSKPLYIFTMANGSFVAVDTVSGKVAPIS